MPYAPADPATAAFEAAVQKAAEEMLNKLCEWKHLPQAAAVRRAEDFVRAAVFAAANAACPVPS